MQLVVIWALVSPRIGLGTGHDSNSDMLSPTTQTAGTTQQPPPDTYRISRVPTPPPLPLPPPPPPEDLPPPFVPGKPQVAAGVSNLGDRDVCVSSEVVAPLDPNLACPKCTVVFRKGEIQKFRLHVQHCTS